MQADPRAQRELLELSAVDTEVAQLRHQRQSLPQHAQLVDLNHARHGIAEQLIAVATQLSDDNAELARLDSDLVAARTRLERDRKRVADGLINDARGLKSINEEIDHLGRRISDLEDAQLEVMQRIEDATAEEQQLSSSKGGIEDRMRALMSERDAAGAGIDARMDALSAQRAALTGGLPADLLALYERVAAKAGTGAALLRAGRCTGCGLELDNSTLRAVAAAADTAVMRCEECGRVLVRTQESGLA